MTTHPSPAYEPTPHWAWVGAHGGAGTTTLHNAVPGGSDLGRHLPAQLGLPDLPVVVVCRLDTGGITAARTFARDNADKARILGLVAMGVIRERRPPPEIAAALRVTAGAYPALWEVPWVSAWRLGPPTPANSPQEIRTLLVDVWHAVGLALPNNPTPQPSKRS